MNVEKIREDFPILKKAVYLDSACMALKPKQVVEEMNRYFMEFPACGERSSHRLGKIVTEEYHRARKEIAAFIGAKPEELIFTKNTTEGLNLAAHSLPLEKDNIVITSDKEHNSNLLPWTRFNHRMVPTREGFFDVKKLEEMMSQKVKVVSVLQNSNIDGMEFPAKEIGKLAHDHGAYFVVDGAQSAPHKEVDVKKMGCDIFSFSGHKMLGPSIGCVYINSKITGEMRPFMVGGGTVANVIDGKPQYLKAPEMFEAGLQNYAGAMGLRAAVEYLRKIGMKEIGRHEEQLNKIMTEGIEGIKGVNILGGKPEERSGIVSFNIKGIDSKELALMMDSFKVLIRGGYHCCHNWFHSNNIEGSARASLYLYNNKKDAEEFVEAVGKAAKLA